MSIPRNAEHMEAAQAEVNEKRNRMKAEMTPTEIARLEVIEDCSRRLEEAQVPFQLWAASVDGKEGDGSRNSWWCFHRLSYTPREDVETYDNSTWQAWNSLWPQLITHQTSHAAVTIVTHSSKTGAPVSIHTRGEMQYIPPSPDLPTGQKL